MVIKVYNKVKVENSVFGKVKVLFEKKGNGYNKKFDIVLIVKLVMKVMCYKLIVKEKVIYIVSKDLFKYVRRLIVGRYLSLIVIIVCVSFI